MALFNPSVEFSCPVAVDIMVTPLEIANGDFGVDWDAVCRKHEYVANESVWASVFDDATRTALRHVPPTINPVYEIVYKVIYIYLQFILCMIGLLANILIVVIIIRCRRSATLQVLLAMAVVDEMFLVGKSIIPGMMLAGHTDGSIIESKAVIAATVLVSTTEVMAVLMMLVITTERFIMACWPLKARTLVTVRRARWSIAMVLLTAVVYRIPMYVFCMDTLPDAAYETFTKVYEIGIDGVCVILIPLLLLLFMNGKLIYTVLVAKRRRKDFTACRPLEGGRNVSVEASMTCNVIVVVLLFIICQTLRLIFILRYTDDRYWNNKLFKKSLVIEMHFIIDPIAHVMYELNASVKFFFYLLLFPLFRRQFIEMVCPCKKRSHTSVKVSNTNSAGVSSKNVTKETTLTLSCKSESRLTLTQINQTY